VQLCEKTQLSVCHQNLGLQASSDHMAARDYVESAWLGQGAPEIKPDLDQVTIVLDEADTWVIGLLL
jgi:hypothetical protein